MIEEVVAVVVDVDVMVVEVVVDVVVDVVVVSVVIVLALLVGVVVSEVSDCKLDLLNWPLAIFKICLTMLFLRSSFGFGRKLMLFSDNFTFARL